MTRSLLSWLRGGFGQKSGRRTVVGRISNPSHQARRRSFVPWVFLLEDRTLLSVEFTPAPYAVPANRPDTPLTPISNFRPVEPYLSVSPADPGDIAVSQGNRIRVSTAAGGSFTGSSQFGSNSNGDTSTTYDGAGRLFWVNVTDNLARISIIQVDPTNGGILNTHVVDQVPNNNFVDDKDFIAADPSNNNLYVIWTRFGPSDTQVLMRYSSDQGASWSALRRVDNGRDNFVWPATVTVAPDHMVYAAYHSVSGTAQPDVPDHDGKVVVVRFNNDSARLTLLDLCLTTRRRAHFCRKLSRSETCGLTTPRPFGPHRCCSGGRCPLPASSTRCTVIQANPCLDEPYASIAHVRICGVPWAVTCPGRPGPGGMLSSAWPSTRTGRSARSAPRGAGGPTPARSIHPMPPSPQ